MFEEMISNIQEDSVRLIMNSHIDNGQNLQREKVAEPVNESHGETTSKSSVKSDKVGRNELCPCGSGKKYKRCCGAG
jgi:preprotein translocase subunit SecA